MMLIGSFFVSSKKLCITDPCYVKRKIGPNNAKFGIPVEDGSFEVYGEISPSFRVQRLRIEKKKLDQFWQKLIDSGEIKDTYKIVSTEEVNIDVDSGQICFFDDAEYLNDKKLNEKFYKKLCNLSHDSENATVCCGFYTGKQILTYMKVVDGVGKEPLYKRAGFVSGTYYGDGSYTAILSYNEDGNCVKVEIDYDPVWDEEE